MKKKQNCVWYLSLDFAISLNNNQTINQALFIIQPNEFKKVLTLVYSIEILILGNWFFTFGNSSFKIKNIDEKIQFRGNNFKLLIFESV